MKMKYINQMKNRLNQLLVAIKECRNEAKRPTIHSYYANLGLFYENFVLFSKMFLEYANYNFVSEKEEQIFQMKMKYAITDKEGVL